VKNKCKKGMLDHFSFFWRKIPLDLQKIENDVGTFYYWFWFGNNFENV
jgi:hypothetical protein